MEYDGAKHCLRSQLTEVCEEIERLRKSDPLMPANVTYRTRSNMKNTYKIDFNIHVADSYPYALYVKPPGLFRRWKHVASFKIKAEAVELHKKLVGLPEYL